jgi:hypothetical protein
MLNAVPFGTDRREQWTFMALIYFAMFCKKKIECFI